MTRTVAALVVAASIGMSASQTAREGAGQVPVSGTAAIGGTLVGGDATAAPIRRARVTLSNVDRTIGRTVVTDDSGRFLFSELPAGRYVLEAAKGAWLSAAFGAKRPGRPGTPIAVADGERLTAVVLPMWRGAVVTGSVRDELGRPVSGVTVAVLQPILRGDIEVLNTPAVTAVTTTDELGTYRTYGLPPGEVVVIATTTTGIERSGTDYRPLADGEAERLIANPSRIAPRQRPLSLAPVFHPSATDPAAAARITLAAGEERSGIDIVLRLVPTSVVQGVVTGPNGAPWPGAQVSLTSLGPQLTGGTGINGVFRATSDQNGAFRFTAILPGAYSLLAAALASPPPPPVTSAAGVEHVHPPDNAETLWALNDLQIAGQDLDVPLALQPTMSIRGRVVIDSATAAPRPSGLSLRLQSAGQGPASVLTGSTTLAPGATEFTIFSVLPGRYRLVLVAPAGSPWVARSSVLRGQDSLDMPIEVRPAEHVTDWVVTITDRPAELSGRITDAAGTPQPDHFLVVFSADRAFWRPPTRRVVQMRPGVDGRFSVRGLPAGDYLLAALTDVEANDLNKPAFLEQLVTGAIRISLADAERKVQDLRIK